MPRLPTSPLPSSQSDEVIIIPSETLFNREEWNAIRDGALKGASRGEKLKLKEIIAKRFPTKRRAKTGPKGSAPTDLARFENQRFIWLLREILRAPTHQEQLGGGAVRRPRLESAQKEKQRPGVELTEQQVCAKACYVLHNFNTFCEGGTFLSGHQISQLVGACAAQLEKNHSLDRREKDVLADIVDLARCQRLTWEELGKRQRRKSHVRSRRFESLDASRLVGEVLPYLVGATGVEFLIFSKNRSRASSGGRPKERVRPRRMMVNGWDRRPRCIWVGRGSISSRLVRRYDLATTGPTKVEVFRKVVGRLLYIKNLISGRVAVEPSCETWSAVLSCHQGEWQPVTDAGRLVCDFLWDAAIRQPIHPIDGYAPIEAAGQFVEIAGFGVLDPSI
jgi:hypothetical protein